MSEIVDVDFLVKVRYALLDFRYIECARGTMENIASYL